MGSLYCGKLPNLSPNLRPSKPFTLNLAFRTLSANLFALELRAYDMEPHMSYAEPHDVPLFKGQYDAFLGGCMSDLGEGP